MNLLRDSGGNAILTGKFESYCVKVIKSSFGKAFLFSLGAGGQLGVERLLENMHYEIRRNMILMGCKSVKELDRSKIIYRN